MRTFLQHLSEVQKTYDFRVKLANIDPAECIDRIRSALETWQLVEMSPVKRLPIQENVIEFPSFGPTEVFQFDVSLAYPCIDAQLRQLVSERCNMLASAISVVPKNHPEEMWRSGEGTNELRDYVQAITGPLVEDDASSKKLKITMKIISLTKASLKSDKDALSAFNDTIEKAKKLTEQKRYYISNYGFKNATDYINCKTDKLIEDESFDKYNLENIIAWWKNKATNRYETLNTEGRLRTELEVWTNNNNIDIIR